MMQHDVKGNEMTKTVNFKDVKPILEAFKRKEITADEAVAAMFKLPDA